MPNSTRSRLKTLYVRQILEEETDEEHGLTLKQIIARLADYGIPAERKSIYSDLQTLKDFGVDIQTYQRNPIEYAVVSRDFSLSELMLLVDAVESCKSLTKRQSNALVTNLKLLASDSQRALLERRIHVPGRILSKNDSVFGNIDLLHDAIRQHKQVEFKYYRYGVDGKRYATHEEKPHEVTPVAITYEDEYYYLTAWNDKYENMIEFRVDRMDGLRLSDKKATSNEEITHYVFDGDEYKCFGRFRGDPLTVTLLVSADKIEIIIDQFGDTAQIYKLDDETAKAVVKVHKSEQFFGWIAGLGGKVKIDKPTSLLNEYRDYLKSLIEE